MFVGVVYKSEYRMSRDRIVQRRGSRCAHLALPIRALICAVALVALTSVGTPVSCLAQSKRVATEKTLMDAEKAMLRSLSARSVEKSPVKAPTRNAVRPPIKAPKALPQKTTSASVSDQGKTKSTAPVGETGGVKTEAPDIASTTQYKELQAALTRIAILEQQLDEARSQLAISETEVSRLSGIVDSKARAGMDKYKLSIPANRAPVSQPRRVVAEQRPVRPPVSDNSPAKVDDALHVATVTVEKAELRLGPGKNHSALMTVRQGSRLMIEARQGEWYRVFAPNGERAWIQASLVRFGDGAALLNDGSSVRVKGFSVGAEEEAFRKLQRITAGQ